jgi:hypothetical protein
MPEEQERRAVPRTTLGGHLPVRLQDGRDVRVLNLSGDGAQIEHFDILRPTATCHLELPPPFGAVVLPARVVWCTVIGRKRRPGGESRLVARSGLRFAPLTVAQHTALAWLLSTSPRQQQPAA